MPNINPPSLTSQSLAGRLIAENFHGWPDGVREDFEHNAFNGRVGSRLHSESDRVRVWEIRLQPGQRVGAHRHVLDYFWTAIQAGHSRQHTADGTTREVAYLPGETHHYAFGPGEYLLHDLENIGTTELIFSTIEFLNGHNQPLPLS
jgi:beta-alanine degradation protein BauB